MSADTNVRDLAVRRIELEAERTRVEEQLGKYMARQRAASRRALIDVPAGDVLYPVVPQSAYSRCTYCWQPKPDLAIGRDPGNPEILRRLCGSCHHALNTGRPADVSTEQVAEAWEWLAHQHINDRAVRDAGTPAMGTGVTDTVIDEALRDLAPHLTPEQGRQAVEELEEMLLQRQDAQNGDVNYDELDPEWRDGEVYANRCCGLVDDSLAKLVGER